MLVIGQSRLRHDQPGRTLGHNMTRKVKTLYPSPRPPNSQPRPQGRERSTGKAISGRMTCLVLYAWWANHIYHS